MVHIAADQFVEEKTIDKALVECRKLSQNICLALIQVKMLNSKFISSYPCIATKWIETTPKTTINICSTNELPTLRTIQTILQNSVTINMKVIKIRRSVESILIRVTAIAKFYCEKPICQQNMSNYCRNKGNLNEFTGLDACLCSRKRMFERKLN